MTKIMNPDFQPRKKRAAVMPNRIKARLQFATWMRETHPALFERAVKYAETDAKVSGLGAETQSFWQKLGSGLTSLGSTYLALKNQRDAMKMNLARAEQGLPPLDVASSAPVIRTQIDIDPQLAQRLASTAGEGISRTMLIIAGVVLGGFFIMKKL